MFFYYETVQNKFEFMNLSECDDVTLKDKRITVSPVATTLVRKVKTETAYQLYSGRINFGDAAPESRKYIIAVGVGTAPYQWCGPDDQGLGINNDNPNVRNIFSLFKEKQMSDLRNGLAFVMFDQTHEGYHAPWLFDWFHNSCRQFNIPPKQVIYFTGDIDVKEKYQKWAAERQVSPDICMVGWPHFEDVIYDVSKGYHEFGIPHPGKIELRKLPDFEHQISFKKFNPSGIKSFNILQKRQRIHRLWFYKFLYDADLVNSNIVSMNKFESWQTFVDNKGILPDECAKLNTNLPLVPDENPINYTQSNFTSDDGGAYIIKINDITMLQTWCSIVSEASCGDWEGNCFISEKTFKPIACQHPFMILGSRHVLRNLRQLGYKTFDPYINEEYDELPTFERMEAIIGEMKRIQNMSIPQKFKWYYDIEGILKYNFRHLENRCADYVKTVYTILQNHIGA